MAEAEKKLKGDFFSKWFTGIKYDEAADDYKRAGNLFKLAKNLQKAGEAYYKAGETLLLAKSSIEAAHAFSDAATCWRKTSPKEAAQCLERLISLVADEGRFSMAAKHEKDLAELYEKDILDIDSAMVHYERAAELYDQENAPGSAKPCLIKLAKFAAEKGDYPKAIELYEKIAKGCLENRLTQWGSREFFFKAGVCYLAQQDLIGTKKAIERYINMYPNFERDRECELLQKIVKAVEDFDPSAFTNAVRDYDEITKLEDFLVPLLVKVRKGISEEGGDGESEEEEKETKNNKPKSASNSPSLVSNRNNKAGDELGNDSHVPVEELTDSDDDHGLQ